MFGSRRSKKKISVLHWYFRNNYLSTSSSRHSGRNLIDPSLQDNVIIQRGFFQHIYHIGCASSSSFCHQQWIDTWRSEFKQETESILFAYWSQRQRPWRSCNDWVECTSSSAIRAQRMEEAPRRGILGWYWSWNQKGLTFYQTRSHAIIFQETLPAYCIPKIVRLKPGEVLYEKSFMSPRPPPKISLRHDHDWTRVNDELGSTVEQQPEGKLVQQYFG